MSSEFHAGFKREGTGVHTVEGTLSGPRAAKLTKKRETEQAEYEAKKRRIQDEYKRGGLKIDEKFGGSATDQFEAMFKYCGWSSSFVRSAFISLLVAQSMQSCSYVMLTREQLYSPTL
eukprot:9399-Heterococcus_DN1.PRE.7